MEITWNEVVDIVKEHAPSLCNYHRIVGVSRGGVIVASLIQRFHPKSELGVIASDCKLFVGDDDVLVVDDIWDTGHTLRKLNRQAYKREGNLDFFTLTSKTNDTLINHSFGMLVPSDQWIVFPWEIEGDEQ